jgi:hypothetical protein
VFLYVQSLGKKRWVIGDRRSNPQMVVVVVVLVRLVGGPRRIFAPLLQTRIGGKWEVAWDYSRRSATHKIDGMEME